MAFWAKKPQYTTLKSPTMRDRIPAGLLAQCQSCYAQMVTREFEENQKVCLKCGHHHRLTARERIALISDPNSFVEMFNEVQPANPLEFTDSKDYPSRIASAKRNSGYDEAVMVGDARIHGVDVALGVMVFEFVGGSMGSVVGERLTRLIEHATERDLPLIIVSATGGARMQEGILSLMQMAKTSGALTRLAARRQPFISVLSDPSTAGVMASFASLGDVIIAEPNTLIGFAGARVIEQTIRQVLPKGFQRSQFVMEHGFLDMVVERKEMKDTLSNLVYYFTGQKAKRGDEESSERDAQAELSAGVALVAGTPELAKPPVAD